MTIETRLAEIRALCDAATEGPWDARQYPQGGGRVYTPGGYPLPGCFNCGENDAVYEEGDTEFIAASRTDLPTLLAAVEAVMELHTSSANSVSALHPDPACNECGQTYPCPTVQAITAALEVEG